MSELDTMVMIEKRNKKVDAFNGKNKIIKCKNCGKKYHARIDAMQDFYVCPHCACIGNPQLKGKYYDLTYKGILDFYKKLEEGTETRVSAGNTFGLVGPYRSVAL
jgi:hypothetical protein